MATKRVPGSLADRIYVYLLRHDGEATRGEITGRFNREGNAAERNAAIQKIIDQRGGWIEERIHGGNKTEIICVACIDGVPRP